MIDLEVDVLYVIFMRAKRDEKEVRKRACEFLEEIYKSKSHPWTKLS